jgi:alcohol dehydrogenase
MCLLANLLEKAISILKTTAPHAVSYPFTGHFGIHHAHTVSLTFNNFLKFNFNNIKYADCDFSLKKKYDILFNLSKTSNINEFDLFIRDLKRKANLETNFKKINIDIKKLIPLILKGVNLQRLSNNPINLKFTDLKSILLKNK